MAQQIPPVDRSNALYERAPMTLGDEPTYNEVKSALELSFAPGNVEKFLKAVQRSNARIREFEPVLNAGALGSQTAALYNKLPDGDQGMIREQYLASLEQVDPNLRKKYFKLYAYY